jgi:hypothetical protein
MAGKTKRKSGSKAKTTGRTAASRPADATRLREVIDTLIVAKRSGDHRASARATAELGKLTKGEGPVQQAASEAHAVAGHGVMVDSLRLLGGIAARLGN